MSLIDVKCPFCGEAFKAELENEITLCNKCGEEFPTSKGSKYYKSINKIQVEKTKIAMGEIYAKVDVLLDKGEFYLNHEEFESAYDIYMQALDLTTVDYRVYLGLVYATTKNFTDLEDEEHKDYINKAIACADSEAKREIVKEYKVCFVSSTTPPLFIRFIYTGKSFLIYNTFESNKMLHLVVLINRSSFYNISYIATQNFTEFQ